MRKEDWDKPSVVYWIHFPEHTDPFKEGYIGISTNLIKRIKDHESRNVRLRDSLLKGAIVTILEECESLQKAAIIETNYRPTQRIGWNIQAGGQIPPIQTDTSYVKHRLKGQDRTEAQKQASKIHSERQKGRNPWNKGIKTPVEIHGITYDSFEIAAKRTGKALSTIYRWVYEGKARKL